MQEFLLYLYYPQTWKRNKQKTKYERAHTKYSGKMRFMAYILCACVGSNNSEGLSGFFICNY